MKTPEVFIVGGARTPMTDYVGALKDLSALELGAIAARAAFAKTGVKPEWVDHAVVGNVLQTSSDAIYGARHVALKAGVPVEVPALTVNRLCGSGIQAAVSGAQMIQLGEAGRRADGRHREHEPGAARDSRPAQRPEARAGQARRLISGKRCSIRTAAARWRSRPRTARPSTASAARSRIASRCAASSSPIARGRRGGSPTRSCRSRSRRARACRSSTQDDHLRPETTLDVLAKLPPAFKKDGDVTAGNASGIVDGGAALILASREAAVDRHGLKPLGRLVDWAAVGVDPTLMGMGPAPATRKVLERSRACRSTTSI